MFVFILLEMNKMGSFPRALARRRIPRTFCPARHHVLYRFILYILEARTCWSMKHRAVWIAGLNIKTREKICIPGHERKAPKKFEGRFALDHCPGTSCTALQIRNLLCEIKLSNLRHYVYSRLEGCLCFFNLF